MCTPDDIKKIRKYIKRFIPKRSAIKMKAPAEVHRVYIWCQLIEQNLLDISTLGPIGYALSTSFSPLYSLSEVLYEFPGGSPLVNYGRSAISKTSSEPAPSTTIQFPSQNGSGSATSVYSRDAYLPRASPVFYRSLRRAIEKKFTEGQEVKSRDSIHAFYQFLLDNTDSIVWPDNRTERPYIPRVLPDFTLRYKTIEYEVNGLELRLYLGNPLDQSLNLYYRILPTDNTSIPESGEGFYHPHIDAQGYHCEGEFAPDIQECLANYDIDGLVDYIMMGLPHYNTNSPFIRLSRLAGVRLPVCGWTGEACDVTVRSELYNCDIAEEYAAYSAYLSDYIPTSDSCSLSVWHENTRQTAIVSRTHTRQIRAWLTERQSGSILTDVDSTFIINGERYFKQHETRVRNYFEAKANEETEEPQDFSTDSPTIHQ